MGLFWDLVQQSQISSAQQETQNLDARVRQLESDLLHTREMMQTLIARLETHFGQDMDGDGWVSGGGQQDE